MLTTLSFIFLLGVILLLEVTAPFTKVEESLNIQATHDFIGWGSHLESYDHHEFPGVVPRTFAGSAALSSAGSLVHIVADALFGSALRTRILELHTIRCVLGGLVATSIWVLARSLPIPNTYTHKLAASLLMISSGLTYHIAFYASRALPNTFALVFVNCSMALVLRERTRCGFALLALTAAVFRSDVLVFVAPLALLQIFSGRIGIVSGCVAGIIGAAIALVATVPLDSTLWGRPIWPEAIVLLFNTVDNKSSEWGTSPFHWYFTAALPKGFLLMTPFVFGAPLFTRHCRKEFLASVLFIALYSLLPHKEVRFILIAFPTLLCPLACWVGECGAKLNKRRHIKIIATLAVGGILLAQLCTIIGFHHLANRRNYPGAEALIRVFHIHDRERARNSSSRCGARVYVDAYAGMTGISRFVKRVSGPHCEWSFNKNPLLFNSTSDTYDTTTGFDYLIVREGDKAWHAGRGLYDWVEDVETVGMVNIGRFRVEMVPFLSILRRKVSAP